MIDLHSHILFDLDDGARTLEESIEMAKMAAADGIRIIAATPHSPASSAGGRYAPALVRERITALNAALASEAVPIQIVAGTEIRYAADLVAQLQSGALLPYGTTKTILLELPDEALPPTLDTTLFNLQLAGYRVVLAHPERIRDVQRKPERLIPLIERGVLMQITAEALIGAQGERLHKSATALLIQGMVHLIASDAHGLPPQRAPLLAQAHECAAQLLGADLADALVTTTPAAVLAGRSITLAIPEPIQPRRWSAAEWLRQLRQPF